MRAWIEEHPYMAGGLVLLIVVLIYVFVRRGGSSSQVIQTGPSEGLVGAQLSAAVRLAEINAGANAQGNALNAAIAAKKIDAQTTLAVSGAQKDVALTGILTTGQTQRDAIDATLQASQYSTQAVVQQQRIAADAGVRVAGIQADVLNEKSRNELAAQGIVSKASVDMAGINALVDSERTKAALAGLLDINRTSFLTASDEHSRDIQIAQVSGDTSKTIARLDAETKQLGTTVAGNVYTDFINTQGRNVDNYINTQGQIKAQQGNIVYGLVSSGQINKGGEGGLNQTSIIDSFLGNFTGGAVAAGSQTPDTPGTTLSAGAQFTAGLAKLWSAIF